jgi:hypothetical protein
MTVYRGLPVAHVAPVIITPASPESLGTEIAALAIGAPPTSTAWFSANAAAFIPFRIGQAATVLKLGWHNGGVVSGNVDCGIYNEAGSRIVSAGSTPASGTSAIQAVDTTDITLQPGRYYLALAVDNTTQTFLAWSLGVAAYVRMLALANQASAFPLPATATLAIATSISVPICGLSLRTLFA